MKVKLIRLILLAGLLSNIFCGNVDEPVHKQKRSPQPFSESELKIVSGLMNPRDFISMIESDPQNYQIINLGKVTSFYGNPYNPGAKTMFRHGVCINQALYMFIKPHRFERFLPDMRVLYFNSERMHQVYFYCEGKRSFEKLRIRFRFNRKISEALSDLLRLELLDKKENPSVSCEENDYPSSDQAIDIPDENDFMDAYKPSWKEKGYIIISSRTVFIRGENDFIYQYKPNLGWVLTNLLNGYELRGKGIKRFCKENHMRDTMRRIHTDLANQYHVKKKSQPIIHEEKGYIIISSQTVYILGGHNLIYQYEPNLGEWVLYKQGCPIGADIKCFCQEHGMWETMRRIHTDLANQYHVKKKSQPIIHEEKGYIIISSQTVYIRGGHNLIYQYEPNLGEWVLYKQGCPIGPDIKRFCQEHGICDTMGRIHTDLIDEYPSENNVLRVPLWIDQMLFQRDFAKHYTQSEYGYQIRGNIAYIFVPSGRFVYEYHEHLDKCLLENHNCEIIKGHEIYRIPELRDIIIDIVQKLRQNTGLQT